MLARPRVLGDKQPIEYNCDTGIAQTNVRFYHSGGKNVHLSRALGARWNETKVVRNVHVDGELLLAETPQSHAHTAGFLCSERVEFVSHPLLAKLPEFCCRLA